MGFLEQPILSALQAIFGGARTIDDIDVQVVLTENTNDTLTVTKQPVQQGASITDHSYKEPTAFSASLLFKDARALFSQTSEIYEKLLNLQNSRIPFTITTPKRVYEDMLMTVLSQTTDKSTENCLSINASFQQVLLVEVATTTVPRIKQKFPSKTAAIVDKGKKSAAATLVNPVKTFTRAVP